ncbi:hypothetical protein HPB52_022041 [Rhipicephalus sanguineus]|uniref:THAP-type domain-containing protein n=1 Tax=Rhipicephalus sanguineus TaxID=34632 RepID=A0A9D4PSR3_RHISA|nr:hypothetical protein HPB52_022041 [Rhipicephalus sanguineus]
MIGLYGTDTVTACVLPRQGHHRLRLKQMRFTMLVLQPYHNGSSLLSLNQLFRTCRSKRLSSHVQPQRRAVWLRAINRDGPDGLGSESGFVCSDHFLPEEYQTNLNVLRSLGLDTKNARLKRDAVPTQNLLLDAPPKSSGGANNKKKKGVRSWFFHVDSIQVPPRRRLLHRRRRCRCLALTMAGLAPAWVRRRTAQSLTADSALADDAVVREGQPSPAVCP